MFSIAIISLTILGFLLGLLLGLASRYLKVETDPVVSQIESMMPGSQCGQCGFPGCKPAAEAIAHGEAEVTICPPGGRSLVARIADLLGIEVDLSKVKEKKPMYAKVSEATCIGCTRCFKVCPTDAIIGGPKQIHGVFKDACTACEACIDVCPTECLQMVSIETTLGTWRWPKPEPDYPLPLAS
ncbi:MAG: electron transport complex subunit RsxB [Gammaproteobacteria bacterium]